MRHTIGSGTCGEVRVCINRTTGKQVSLDFWGAEASPLERSEVQVVDAWFFWCALLAPLRLPKKCSSQLCPPRWVQISRRNAPFPLHSPPILTLFFLHLFHLLRFCLDSPSSFSSFSSSLLFFSFPFLSLQYAVKILSLSRFSSPLTPGLSAAELKGEAEMLRDLDHPYIVKMEDVFTSDNAVFLIMELCHGGDLFDRIVSLSRYPETTARYTSRRILAAVQYLHAKNIVHRDLKPENILLLSRGDHYSLKVTDFGLAKKANKDGLRTFCGTPQYFAPEVRRRGRERARKGEKWGIYRIFVVSRYLARSHGSPSLVHS